MNRRLAFLFAVVSLFASVAHAQNACNDSCQQTRAQCRTDAERIARQDGERPPWVDRDQRIHKTFSRHTSPSTSTSPEARAESYSHRRGERLAACEDRHRSCVASCQLQAPRSTATEVLPPVREEADGRPCAFPCGIGRPSGLLFR